MPRRSSPTTKRRAPAAGFGLGSLLLGSSFLLSYIIIPKALPWIASFEASASCLEALSSPDQHQEEAGSPSHSAEAEAAPDSVEVPLPPAHIYQHRGLIVV